MTRLLALLTSLLLGLTMTASPAAAVDITRPCATPNHLNCTWYGYPAGGVDVYWTNVRRPDGAVYCQLRRVPPNAGVWRCETYWPFTKRG